jgi:hypothetical protein
MDARAAHLAGFDRHCLVRGKISPASIHTAPARSRIAARNRLELKIAFATP